MLKTVKTEGLKTVINRIGYGVKRKADDDKRYARLLKKNVVISGRKVKSDAIDEFASKLNNIGIINVPLNDKEYVSLDTIVQLVAESKKEYVGLIGKNTDIRDVAFLHLDAVISKCFENGENIDIFYTDEDREDDRKVRCNPVFKPELSVDTLLSFNYIGDFWCAKRELVMEQLKIMAAEAAKTAEAAKAAEAAKNDNLLSVKYELLLRMIIGQHVNVKHVECVAVTKSLDEYIGNDYVDMKKRVFDSIGFEYEDVKKFSITYPMKDSPLVSIIIPTKDHPELLKQCVESIVAETTYKNFELVVVDNGSSEENKNKNAEILENSTAVFMYVYKPMEFNFSAMCNTGASKANGEYLLFLNDDIEIPKDETGYDWLSVLTGQATRSWTGAVGAKLLFPDKKTYQHLGMINLIEYGFDHIYGRFPIGTDINEYRDVAMYNYLAVTGACLMVSKEKFLSLGGFNLEFAVTYNDVDLCLRLLENGWYSVVRNDVVLIHHESVSRGEATKDEEALNQNLSEKRKLINLHPWVAGFDPYYSRFYSSEALDCSVNSNVAILKKCLIKKTDMDVNKLAQYDVQTKEEDRPSDESVEVMAGGGVIDYAQITDVLRITGYAFLRDKHGRAKEVINPKLVLFNKDNCYTVNALSFCDRTFNRQLGLAENINFAPFICLCDLSKINIEKGVYRVAVLYRNRILGNSYRLENL